MKHLRVTLSIGLLLTITNSISSQNISARNDDKKEVLQVLNLWHKSIVSGFDSLAIDKVFAHNTNLFFISTDEITEMSLDDLKTPQTTSAISKYTDVNMESPLVYVSSNGTSAWIQGKVNYEYENLETHKKNSFSQDEFLTLVKEGNEWVFQSKKSRVITEMKNVNEIGENKITRTKTYMPVGLRKLYFFTQYGDKSYLWDNLDSKFHINKVDDMIYFQKD